MELLEGERVLWRGRPSWRAYLGYFLKYGTLALALGVIVEILKDTSWDGAPRGYAWGITVVLLLIVVIVGMIRKLQTLYTVTSERIHIRKGILSRRDHSTTHARVQNVNSSQGIIDRILGTGDVDFDTAGSDDFEFRFYAVRHPEALVRLVAEVEAEVRARESGGPGPGRALDPTTT
jgi:uncharacterized membrane protein YdbT with pleckstrin-like domain